MNAVVIGVGNRLRGDDGIGLAVAEQLQREPLPGAQVLTLEHVPPDLFERWDAATAVVLVDAASSGAAPGTVRRLDARGAPLPAETLRLSTHGFGIPEAIELARALDRLPAQLVVYAVEGVQFEQGSELTPAVQAAAAEVATRIRTELEAGDA